MWVKLFWGHSLIKIKCEESLPQKYENDSPYNSEQKSPNSSLKL